MNLEMITLTGDVEHENIICLTHYSKDDIVSFSNDIKDKILNNNQELELHNASYIKAINCSLILRKNDIEKGIYLTNENNLICELNEESYLNMAEIIEQFLDDNNSGFNWLIDIVNSEFDLLMNDTISW